VSCIAGCGAGVWVWGIVDLVFLGDQGGFYFRFIGGVLWNCVRGDALGCMCCFLFESCVGVGGLAAEAFMCGVLFIFAAGEFRCWGWGCCRCWVCAGFGGVRWGCCSWRFGLLDSLGFGGGVFQVLSGWWGLFICGLWFTGVRLGLVFRV